jgi:hypothetical protein
LDVSTLFLISLSATLSVLAVTVWSGFKARLKVHLPFVGLSLICLGITIYFAERLGREYDLDKAGIIKPVHLTLAKLATASFLLPVTSGVMTLRNRKHRKLHLTLAMLALLLTVLAAVTGTVMVMRAEPLAVVG